MNTHSVYTHVYDCNVIILMFCVFVVGSNGAWEPTMQEIQLLAQNPKRRKINENSTIGKSKQIPEQIKDAQICHLLYAIV